MTSALLAYLVSSLWQAPLLVLLTAGVLSLFRNANATTRYAAWFATLVAILAVPLASTAWLYAAHSGLPVHHVAITVPGLLADGALGLWAALALLALLRVGAASLALGKLKRDALPLTPEYRDAMPLWNACADAAGGRETRLCVSPDVAVPVAVGLFDGLIVMPDHVLETFASGDIDRFTLHELAHLRRRDDWTCMVQRLIGALLFFNPLVAFVARRLDLEREVACDDWVVSLTDDVRPYAVGLTRMAEATARGHRPLATPAVFATRKSLSIRIERLLTRRRDARPRLSASPLTLSVAASVALLAVAAPLAPVVGVAREIAPAAPVVAAAPVRPARPQRAHQPVKTAAAARPAPARAAREPAHVAVVQPAAPARPTAPVRSARTAHGVAAPPNGAKAASAAATSPVTVAHAAPVEASAAAATSAASAKVAAAVTRAAARRAAVLEDVDRSVEIATDAADRMVERITASLDGQAVARSKGAGPDLLAALNAAGYANLSADDVVALRDQGVSGALVLAAGRSFERRPSVAELMSLASSGVSAGYLRALAEAGLRRVTPAAAIAFVTNGVSAGYAARVLSAVPRATTEDVVALAVRGVASSLVAGVQARGYPFDPAVLADLTAHGVSLGYIDALNAHHAGRFALRDVITLHDHGVSAERGADEDGD